MVRFSRPTCDHEWQYDGKIVQCERYAIITVDGSSYCEKHVSSETDVARYK